MVLKKIMPLCYGEKTLKILWAPSNCQSSDSRERHSGIYITKSYDRRLVTIAEPEIASINAKCECRALISSTLLL